MYEYAGVLYDSHLCTFSLVGHGRVILGYSLSLTLRNSSLAARNK